METITLPITIGSQTFLQKKTLYLVWVLNDTRPKPKTKINLGLSLNILV